MSWIVNPQTLSPFEACPAESPAIGGAESGGKQKKEGEIKVGKYCLVARKIL